MFKINGKQASVKNFNSLRQGGRTSPVQQVIFNELLQRAQIFILALYWASLPSCN